MGMVWLPGDGVAVSGIPAARAKAASAAKAAGLQPGEVIWFDNGFYVELKDSADIPATEVIVDPRTGAVGTEPGPAMMWNTRFAMMRAGSDRAGGRREGTRRRHLVAATPGTVRSSRWRTADPAGTPTTTRALRIYSPPYVIQAIGDLAAMRDALDKSSQVTIYRQYADLLGLGYDVTSKEQARFPAYAGSLSLVYAKSQG
jgi:hypothetical protein